MQAQVNIVEDPDAAGHRATRTSRPLGIHSHPLLVVDSAPSPRASLWAGKCRFGAARPVAEDNIPPAAARYSLLQVS